MTTEVDIPVLVVGGGPVGMMAGLLLDRVGLGALVIERRAGPQRAPAAHMTSARTFEICRQAGLDMKAILDEARSPDEAGHVNFVTQLGGDLIGRLPYEQQGDACLDYTPTPLRNLSQHRFEPLLAAELGRCTDASLQYEAEWESSREEDSHVVSTLQDRATGEKREVRSRYVIAADGAGSRVRASFGIEMQGPPRIQSFMMIHFEADLRELIRDRPGILHFVMDPECTGSFVAHDPQRDWVYMRPVDEVIPGEPPAEKDFDEGTCEGWVRDAIGAEAKLRILHRGVWHMSAQIAERFGQGRVFLAGDAAHRFPPTGGLGLNTGMQDVHGLVWKLAAVEAGWGAPELLETYEAERRPIAHHNTAQSLQNAVKMAFIPQALGTDKEPTRAQMHARLATTEGRAAAAQAVEEQTTHFDMPGLQLGYVYEQGARFSDGTEAAPPESPRIFEPSARPGARLPHAWLPLELLPDRTQAPVPAQVSAISSLDLIGSDGMTLLSFLQHDQWASAVASVEGLPLVHIQISSEFGERALEFQKRCGLSEGGALLVRPDQHVAARWFKFPHEADKPAIHGLGSVLDGVLRRSSESPSRES